MENKFKLDDKVYHMIPESPVGVILDILYSFRTDTYEYVVAFTHDTQSVCREYELSKTKTFQ